MAARAGKRTSGAASHLAGNGSAKLKLLSFCLELGVSPELAQYEWVEWRGQRTAFEPEQRPEGAVAGAKSRGMVGCGPIHPSEDSAGDGEDREAKHVRDKD